MKAETNANIVKDRMFDISISFFWLAGETNAVSVLENFLGRDRAFSQCELNNVKLLLAKINIITF